jgi:cell division protein FtsB
MSNDRMCEQCKGPLVGSQRRFCSNRCKQALKYRTQTQEHAQLRKENERLQRKVKQLTKKLEAVSA